MMDLAWTIRERTTLISVRNKRDGDMLVELGNTSEVYDMKHVSSADLDSQYCHPMEKI